MASESDVSQNPPLLERLFGFRELSVFLPFNLGFSSDSSRLDRQDPNLDTANSEDSNTHGERIILINPFTQGMVVLDGTSSLEALFQEIGMKSGQPPASKESIEAMPSVEIGEGEDGECVICLDEVGVGRVAKEMPCKHKFHQNCIKKWLGIHGSCPVCRYQMPVDEKEVSKRDEEEEEQEAGGGGGERRRVGREIWVSFSFRSENTNQAPSDNSSDPSSSPRGDSEIEN